MGINFNGDVTIIGNVEIYSDRSMKVNTYNQIVVPITELRQFIEENVPLSLNKDDYLDAVTVLSNSEEQSKIQSAVQKIKSLGSEVGKNILIKGLSQAVFEAIKIIT